MRKAIIADDERDIREFLHESLTRMGWDVETASNGSQLLDLARRTRPELIVTDVQMPQMGGIEATSTLFDERPVTIVLVSAHHDDATLSRATEFPVMAYVVKPFTASQLKSAVAVALARFRNFQELRCEAEDLRKALADRKTVERAKGILMRVHGIDEHEAYRRLRLGASSRNQKLVDAAARLIAADEILAEFTGTTAASGTSGRHQADAS